jgi:hypothetical protein
MKAPDKQTKNKRPNGTFAPGNKLGNKFKAGVSGNKLGRPKHITLSEAIRAQLAVIAPDTGGRTYAEVIAEKLCIEAASGNVNAIREVADRTEGRPKQTVDLDLQVSDWRELARNAGLKEEEVIAEAQRLIAESAFDSCGAKFS